MRQRFEACCILRAELAEQAAKTWLKEFREPVEPTSWPAMLDGLNCRGALRIAQERDPHLAAVSKQLRAALSSAYSSDAKLGPKELEEFRHNPLDGVLERRVFLADARCWVPVMPDDTVPCLEPSKSWRRWAFEHSHLIS